MFEINYSQLIQCEILEKLVTYIGNLTYPENKLPFKRVTWHINCKNNKEMMDDILFQLDKKIMCSSFYINMDDEISFFLSVPYL